MIRQPASARAWMSVGVIEWMNVAGEQKNTIHFAIHSVNDRNSVQMKMELTGVQT